jgi:hypothetical protein
MCDYSLGGLPNRLAVDGDELMVHRFPTYSMGLAPAADVQSEVASSGQQKSLWQRVKSFFALTPFCSSIQAVCIPPGASLILKNIPDDLRRKWSVGEQETVLFTQISAEAHTYRDAVCFGNGRQVSLQHLTEGLLVKVLSLEGQPVDDQQPAISEPASHR